jgi:thioredoxin 1
MAAGNIIILTDENFKQTIEKGLTLVDFHADWCGPCKMLAPIIEQLADQVQGRAKIAKIDIDQSNETANAMQITSVPSLILFKDGQEIKRVVGVKDFEYLLQLIDSNA